MPYNIAIFSAYYEPHIGGVERYTRCLAEELAKKGHSVTVITSRAEAEDKQIDERIRLLAIPSLSAMNDRFPIPKPSTKTLPTIKSITHSRFDAVIVNTRYYPISLIGCITAKRNGKKPIVIDHSSGYLSRLNSVSGIVIRAWELAATQAVKHFSPDFYGVSQGSANWLQKLGITAKGVLSNSIDAVSYKRQQSNRQWRVELGVKESTCLIAYVSRLVPEKGIVPLMKAVQKNAAYSDNLTLVVAGDGPLREAIEKSAAKTEYPRIHYVGALGPTDASSLLAESDIFCLPTLYPEGLPTVLLESAVQKNAIIVSNCAGAKDAIPDNEHGTVLEQVNEGTIEEAIRNYTLSPSKRTKAANNVHKHVCENFSWEKTAEAVLKACERANECRKEGCDASSAQR